MNESLNHKGVCRRAPATPCLLNIIDTKTWHTHIVFLHFVVVTEMRWLELMVWRLKTDL